MPTKKKVKIALEGLTTGPDGLHDVYEQTMKRIQSQGRGRKDLAELILLWIVHARRPLSVWELQQALGVEPGSAHVDEDNIPSARILKSVCAGLVQVDEGSNMIGLIHYTTQEYFEKTRSKWFPDAQRYITQTCVAYLSLPGLGGYCVDKRKFKARRAAHPFYDYAAHEWGHHARAILAEPQVIDFLQQKEAVEGALQALIVRKYCSPYDFWDLRSKHWRERFPGCMNGLHLAALLGLHMVAQALLNLFDASDHDSWHRTPLAVAAEEGHLEVVELLLRTGRADEDINSTDIRGRTPLVAATEGGHVAVAKLLIETGKTDVDAAEYGQTPLILAAKHGHSDIVRSLIETGVANIDSANSCGETPLLAAVKGRHLGAAKLLIETGEVDINVAAEGQTPLLLAAGEGNYAMVKLLIEAGNLERDEKKKGMRVALFEAMSFLYGQWDVQGFLEIEQGQYGHFAVIEAARHGFLEATILLTGPGKLDVNEPDEDGRTALVYAARHGRWHIVRHLVETMEAEVDRGDENGRTALMYAARCKRLDMARLLVETGKVGVDRRDESGQTPLIHAVQHGAAAVVCLLLDSGADAGMVDDFGYSALDYAMAHKHTVIKEILCWAGASLEMSSARTTPGSYTEIEPEL